MTTINLRVAGRPAPQGSHEVGANGYVMHSSRYLDAWRHAVKRDSFRAYLDAGLTSADMPLIPYPAPVWVTVLHFVNDEQCRAEGTDDPTGTPDGDKLLRATIDGLGEARAFGDDSQIVGHRAFKARAKQPGAIIQITDERPWWADMDRGDSMPETFDPTGEYRLVLERVGRDADGDRTWETVVEVTDSPEAISDTWLPSLGMRLGRERPTESEDKQPTAAEAPKPTRKPRKAAAEPAPAEPLPVPAPEVAPAPVPVAQAPAERPAPVNPFAR